MEKNISFKLYFISLFILLFPVVAICQQQPENPGFENWEDVGLNVDEPVDWSSIKTADQYGGLAPYVWDQSTDAHSGNYSVKLYNNTVLGIVAAGTLTNGRVHAELAGTGYVFSVLDDARWVTPFTQKPDSVVVWAKFFPQGGDIGQVKAVLNTGSAIIPDAGQADYIALAQINITSQTSSWTRFSAPFTYFNSTDPTYILFVLNAANENAHNGTIAYFDDLQLIYNPLLLDLTVFLQGPYNTNKQMFTDLNPDLIPTSQPYNIAPWNYTGTETADPLPSPDIVDWVLVEIRDAVSAAGANGFTTVGRKAGLLMKDGSIVAPDGISMLSFNNYINNNLYVVVRHRNHLAVMSNFALAKTDGVYSYDFSTASDQTYGTTNGCVQLNTIGPAVWGMIGGDGNANKTVGTEDKTNFWSILVGKTGYLSADYNLDGQTNNPDKNDIWLKNVGKTGQVPN
ncbi:MAG: hypothetical protein JW731_11575 [Bacteroidales bacterium]|nr:hypothetical protein [Bacteroidales bacterium]